VFAVHWAVLAASVALCAHVQVSTRLLSAAAPPLYWHVASLALEGGGGDDAGGGSSGSKSARQRRWAVAVWAVWFAYAAAGAVLFPNFYPWT
jgi:hypothetical protein